MITTSSLSAELTIGCSAANSGSTKQSTSQSQPRSPSHQKARPMCHQEACLHSKLFVRAVLAANARKASAQHTALKIATKLILYVTRIARACRATGASLGKERLGVGAHEPIQHCVFWMASDQDLWSARSALCLRPHKCHRDTQGTGCLKTVLGQDRTAGQTPHPGRSHRLGTRARRQRSILEQLRLNQVRQEHIDGLVAALLRRIAGALTCHDDAQL